jgi:hypothetical protein
LRFGAAKKEAGRAFGFEKIQMPAAGQAVTRQTFSFEVDKAKLKATQQRDGHYSLRSNLIAEDPAVLWTRYVQLTQIESVFRSLKSELSIRPIGHQLEHRAEVWIPIVEVQETGTAVPSQPPPRIKASQITPKLGRRALSCGEAFG